MADPKPGQDSGQQISYVIIGLSVLLMVMMVISLYLEKCRKTFSESLIILFLSTCCSLYFKSAYGFSLSDSIPTNMIFKLLAPPIIFAAGFNLREKYFFKHLGFISLYGFIGTIVSFVVMSTGIFFTNRFLQNYITVDTSDYKWTLITVMKVCAPLINTDTVGPLYLIEEEEYPALHSIIFGEGILNDGAGLILVDTILDLGKPTDVDVGMVQKFTKSFARSSVFSVLYGFVMGGISCLIFKKIKIFKKNASIEIYMILLMAMVTHTFAELKQIELAGVVAIFIFGIVQSHYNRFNLSRESVQKAGFTFGLVSLICESLILIYMGLSFDKRTLIAAPTIIFASADLIILLVSRVVSILVLTAIANKFSKKKKSVSFKETILIAFVGLVRGTIAYAMVIHIGQGEEQSKFIEKMIPLCQLMIVGTIVFFVPLNKLIFGAILRKARKEIKESEEYVFEVGVENRGYGRSRQTLMFQKRQTLIARSDVGCSLLIKRLDELILKPFFIREYELRKEDIKKERRRERNTMMKQTNFMHFAEDNEVVIEASSTQGRSSVSEDDYPKVEEATIHNDSTFRIGEGSFDESQLSKIAVEDDNE